MSEPITKEQRERAHEWATNMAFAVSRDWLRGYEALVVDLERRLRIGIDLLKAFRDEMAYSDLDTDQISEALAAMAKEDK